MDDLRFCLQGCCRFINNLPVSNVEYDAVPRPVVGPSIVEAQIPCRKNIPNVQKITEEEVGFYLGAPQKRIGSTLMTTGGKDIVFDASTGKHLREATDDDMKKWKGAWSQAVKTEREKKKS